MLSHIKFFCPVCAKDRVLERVPLVSGGDDIKCTTCGTILISRPDVNTEFKAVYMDNIKRKPAEIKPPAKQPELFVPFTPKKAGKQQSLYIQFECPYCRTRYDAWYDHVGKLLQCQKCPRTFTIDPTPIPDVLPAIEQSKTWVEDLADSFVTVLQGLFGRSETKPVTPVIELRTKVERLAEAEHRRMKREEESGDFGNGWAPTPSYHAPARRESGGCDIPRESASERYQRGFQERMANENQMAAQAMRDAQIAGVLMDLRNKNKL